MDSSEIEIKRCEVCGDDDLECINGEVTCRMCGTQCSTQKTEVVLDETVQLRYLTQIGGLNQSRVSKAHEKSTRMLPWKLSEAFQIIFLSQVRAVHSHLSLPKDYFEMAIKLWMRYLKATGEAFLSKEDRVVCKYPYGWGRIYDPSQGAENFKGQVKNRRYYQPKTAPNPQRQQNRLNAERSLRNMEFDDDDQPLSSPSSSDTSSSSDSSSSDANASDDNITLALKTLKRKSQVEKPRYWRGWMGSQIRHWLLMEYNLAVCYLPLLYIRVSGRVFGLSDLIDLVRRRLVPYQNARSLLPSSMIIRDKAMCRCFSRDLAPSRHQMVSVTRLLLDLLSMNDLPRYPLLPHISQRVAQLRLPSGVTALARQLALRWLTDDRPARLTTGATFSRHDQYLNVVCPDLIVMAFVLLVLFCLRGRSFTEAQRRQTVVKKLRESCDRADLFLLTEWAPRLAKVYCLGKDVMSIEDSAGFVDLPPVGLLIQDDLGEAEDKKEGEEEKEEEEQTSGRAIQAHEHLLLIQRSKYVKELMEPFETLIERAAEREEEELQQEEQREIDFREHLLCYPVQPGLLQTLVGETSAPTGDASPLLFSQESDPISEGKNERLSQIKEILDALPTAESLGSSVVERLPENPPADFKEVVSLCAHCVAAQDSQLWMTTRHIQLSFMRLSAVEKKKTKVMATLNNCASMFSLKWRGVFIPM